MANQPELPQYDAGVYQLEATDPVDGGVGAVSNKPLLNLADRTAYLKQHVDNLENGTTQPPGMATLNSPAFTGTPTAPTPALGDNSTKIATTAFVQGTVNSVSSVNVAGNANITLTAVQAGAGILVFTGALTGNIAVIVPATSAKWEVSNQTTGAYTLTVKTASGTGSLVTQGKNTVLWCDGTNVNDGKTDFVSPALTGSPTAPTAAIGDNSNLIADTAFIFNAADGMQTVNVAGNSNVTLTQAQYGVAIVNLTGALTGNINLIFPQQTGQWIVANNSTGSFSITGKTSAAGNPTTVTLPQGSAVLVYCDGSNMNLASSVGNQTSFTRSPFSPSAGTKTLTVSTGYTPGNVIVEKNGAVLETPADFVLAIPAPTQNAATTATSGGSLASGTYYYKVTALTAAGETTASNEVSIATANLAVPVANTPTTATTGGSLGAATYYYVVTALGVSGETTKSNEVSVATTGTTSANTVTWAAVPGASGYRVYRGTAAGAESVYYAPGNVTTFTDTGAANTAGTPPASNTAVSSVNTNTVNWGAVTNATGYRVYRGTSAGSENVYYAPGNVTSFTDTGAANTAGSPPVTNTASDGSTITLSSATLSGDVFNVYAFKTFTVANAVQKSGDTMAGPLALFGGDTGTTAAQFDNSTKLATTAFVQRAIGNLQGATILAVSATTVLTASQAGSGFIVQGGGSLTLPLLSSVQPGATFTIASTGVSATSLACSGSDKIQFDGNGTHSVASVSVNGGDTIEVMSIGVSWYCIGGSIGLQYASNFVSSIGASGYQKLPGGLIIQFGTAAPTASADAAIIFPIAFPNNSLSMTLSCAAGTGAGYMATFNNLTKNGVNIGAYSTTSSRVGANVDYMVIGY